jgi:hypothetical protein
MKYDPKPLTLTSRRLSGSCFQPTPLPFPGFLILQLHASTVFLVPFRVERRVDFNVLCQTGAAWAVDRSWCLGGMIGRCPMSDGSPCLDSRTRSSAAGTPERDKTWAHKDQSEGVAAGVTLTVQGKKRLELTPTVPSTCVRRRKFPNPMSHKTTHALPFPLPLISAPVLAQSTQHVHSSRSPRTCDKNLRVDHPTLAVSSK